METGIKNEIELTVTEEMTAERVGSGLLPVYATPEMIAQMEKAASTSVEPYLEEGQGTVGTKVRVESELVEVDRRKLVFDVKAYDEAGIIGRGTHERFIIDNEKFLGKAEAKRTAGRDE